VLPILVLEARDTNVRLYRDTWTFTASHQRCKVQGFESKAVQISKSRWLEQNTFWTWTLHLCFPLQLQIHTLG